MNLLDDNLGFNAEQHASAWREMRKGLSTSPTSLNFDPHEWRALAETATSDSPQYVMATSGYWLGRRLQTLRKAFPSFFSGFTPVEAVHKSVGYANAVYLKNRIEFRRAVKREAKRLGLRSTLLAHTTIKTGGAQQTISEDHLVTTAIDSLAHTLFYAKNASPAAASVNEKPLEVSRVFQFSNIEFVYRAIWLQIQWEGYRLQPDGADVYHLPPSEKYGSWWPVWDVRRQNIIAEEISILSGELMGHLSEGSIPEEIGALIPARRVERANWRDGVWNFKTTPIAPKNREYRSAVLAAIGIRESSLLKLCSEIVPQCDGSKLTLGHILKAWHVIEWALEEISLSVIKKHGFHVEGVDEYAMQIGQEKIRDLIVECAELSSEQANDAIDFLTLDIQNDQKLFNKGVWANPILRISGSHNLSFVMAVFVIGNIVRAFERWIEQAQFARSGELKGSGFEAEVVRELQDSCKNSELPAAVRVVGPNLRIAGEEIDAILRVGELLLVLECKNFLTPGDSLERFNVIKRLRRGAEQATRKAEKIAKSSEGLPAELEISRSELEGIIGVVVSASTYGVGLNFGGVPVVDLSYLSVLVQSMRYISAMAKKGGKIYQEMTHIYEPFGFSIPAFLQVLREPFVQKRYIEALGWRFEPFPSGDPNTRIMLPFPLITAEADAEQAEKMFAGAV